MEWLQTIEAFVALMGALGGFGVWCVRALLLRALKPIEMHLVAIDGKLAHLEATYELTHQHTQDHVTSLSKSVTDHFKSIDAQFDTVETRHEELRAEVDSVSDSVLVLKTMSKGS